MRLVDLPNRKTGYVCESNTEERLCVIEDCTLYDLIPFLGEFGFLAKMPDKLPSATDFLRDVNPKSSIEISQVDEFFLLLELADISQTIPEGLCEAFFDFNMTNFEGDLSQRKQLIRHWQDGKFLILGPSFC